MKKLLLFTLLLTSLLFPQLKEMEVKPTENRGGIPIFRDYPDKAGVILYTQYDNLTFYSSYGIHKVMGDPASGKYVVIIEPAKQSLEVRCPGHKSEIIKINSLQPREVLFYEVLPKKEEGIGGVTEVGITIQATPADAVILLDGQPFSNNKTTKVAIGSHRLQVEKSGYSPYMQEITVTPEKTLFQVNLTTNDPVSVIINSNPADAEIFIDGMSKGKTRKALYIYPGSYDLRLMLSGYLLINEKITVSMDEKQNNFSFNLVKNTGKLKIDVTPSVATVRINKEVINAYEIQELTPGIYQIEAESDTYYPYKGTIEIVLGETKTEKIVLSQKAGKLQFAINPPEAECVLSQNGLEKYRWTGLKIFNSIAEGTYDLTAKALGYKTYSGRITIRENQTIVEDIQMTAGSDGPPAGMIFVEGGTFKMGSSEGQSDEKSVHQVTVGSFLIGKYEVTQELWQSVMGSNPSNKKGNKRPVEKVSWYDAVEFCNKLSENEGLTPAYIINKTQKDPDNTFELDTLKWLVTCDFDANGYRLPTEAEWEYAARGGNRTKGYKYSGSNDIDDVAWYDIHPSIATHEVGKKQPNELGIYDMSGNVWEWCWDKTSGYYRMIRGGDWLVPHEENCLVATRMSALSYSRSFTNGFRLVRTR